MAKTAQRRTSRTKSGRTGKPDPLIIGGVAIFLLIIAAVVYFNVRQSLQMAGEQTFNTQGNAHITPEERNTFVYNRTPPTSGPHYGSLAQWGIHREPVPYELLIHNLEDGGVVIYYQCGDSGCEETRSALEAIVEPYDRADQHVVLAPNEPQWSDGVSTHADMGAPIAVTAWNHLLTLDSVDEARIQAFIAKYLGIDHHVSGGG